MKHAAILILIGLAACVAPDDPQASGEASGLVAEGRQIALTNCAGCHAIDAASASTHAEAPPFRTLSERYPVSTLAESLAEGIIVGHPDMPEFRFEPHEVDALIAFLESIQPDTAG